MSMHPVDPRGGDTPIVSLDISEKKSKKPPGTLKTFFSEAIKWIAAPFKKGETLSAKRLSMSDSGAAVQRAASKAEVARSRKTKPYAKQAQLETVRQKMVDHFKQVLDQDPLSDQSLKAINAALETLRKIDANITSKLLRVGGFSLRRPEESPKKLAPFTVRKVVQLNVEGKDHKVELGRNLKILVHTKEGKNVGKGAYGRVKEVGVMLKADMVILQKTAHTPYAADRPSFKHELAMTARLHKKALGHQHGVQRAPYSLFNLRDGRCGYLVPAYKTDLKESSLKKRQLTFTPDQLKKGALDLLIGLNACHKAGIYHRDIKPENIGMQTVDDKDEWALADFGLAVTHFKEPSKATPIYMLAADAQAQESAVSSDEKRVLLEQQDLFALGRSLLEVCYTSLTGKHASESQWYKDLDSYCCTGGKWGVKSEFAGMQYGKVPDNPHNPVDLPNVKKALDVVENKMGKECRDLLALMISPPDVRPQSVEGVLNKWPG